MKSNLSAPIRFCADGSLKSVRHDSLKNSLSEALAAILLAAFFVLVTMFFLTDPFETYAPQTPAAEKVGDRRGAGGAETILLRTDGNPVHLKMTGLRVSWRYEQSGFFRA